MANEKPNVYTPKQLDSLTNEKSENFNFKAIEKIINSATQFTQQATNLIKQYQTVKGLTTENKEGDGNANAKYEKGVQQGMKQSNKQQQKPLIAYHVDNAMNDIESLVKAYLSQIDDGKTAKELKKEIANSFSKEKAKVKTIIENLMKKHTEIFYNE